jgi:hypothetical protein
MLEPPWRHTGPDSSRGYHWTVWFSNWAWAIAGLIFGALVAPSLVQLAGLSNSPYQDYLDISVAVLTGFVVQLLSLLSLTVLLDVLTVAVRRTIGDRIYAWWEQVTDKVSAQEIDKVSAVVIIGLGVFFVVFTILLMTLPLAAIGYAIYRYLRWVGPGQGQVTVAFAGALLVKAFLIPLIQGIISGAALKWLIGWLRGKPAAK